MLNDFAHKFTYITRIFFRDIKNVTPGLRGMTAVETAIEVEKVSLLNIYQQLSYGRLDAALENYKDEVHFYSKLPSAPVRTIGCEAEKLSAEANSLYLIKVNNPDFSIIWDETQD